MIRIGVGVDVTTGGGVLSSGLGPSSFGTDTELWVDFSASSSVTLNGSTVSQVNDLSSYGRHFTQATASFQPTYTTSAQNGLNAATGDGVNDWLAAAAAADWTFLHDGAKTHLIAVVAKVTSSTGCIYGNTIGGGGIRGTYLYKTGATGLEHACYTGAVFNVLNDQVNTMGTAWCIHTLIAKPGDATAANRSEMFFNAGAADKNSIRTTTPSTSAPQNPLALFAQNGNNYMAGSIGQIVVISGASATEVNRVALRNALNTKWAIY